MQHSGAPFMYAQMTWSVLASPIGHVGHTLWYFSYHATVFAICSSSKLHKKQMLCSQDFFLTCLNEGSFIYLTYITNTKQLQ